MELKRDKLKSILSAKKKLLSFFLLFTGLAVIIVVVSSIYKQYWSSSGTVKVIKHASHKTKPSAAPIPKSSLPKPKQKTAAAEKNGTPVKTEVKKAESKPPVSKSPVAEVKTSGAEVKTSGETKVSKKESSPDVISVIKSAKEQAFIYKAKKEALKEKLEYLKLKKELQQYSQELAPPVMPKPSELSVRLTEIQQKLYELEREIEKGRNQSPLLTLKEKLQQVVSKVKSQVKEDNRKYELLAILDGKAVIRVDGKEYTLKDGEKLFGQKVQIGDFSVKIGDKVLSLNLTSNKQSSTQISLPFIK